MGPNRLHRIDGCGSDDVGFLIGSAPVFAFREVHFHSVRGDGSLKANLIEGAIERFVGFFGDITAVQFDADGVGKDFHMGSVTAIRIRNACKVESVAGKSGWEQDRKVTDGVSTLF